MNYGPIVSGTTDVVQADKQGNRRDHLSAASFLIYLGTSGFWFGRALASAPRGFYIGTSTDPSIYIWALEWWPYALRHRLNPFFSHLIWAPQGCNLAWVPAIPLAAAVTAPVTNTLGPIASFNLLSLLSPALSAWACFLLCRRVCGRFWPALAGGYVFGFSAYMLGQLYEHLVLTFVFPLPLAAYLTLRWMRREIRNHTFVLALGLLLAGQFYLTVEVFATLVLFGAVALLLAWWYGDGGERHRIGEMLPLLAGAFAVALVLTLPYIWSLFGPGYPQKPLNSPAAASADLINLVVPTPLNLLGTLPWLEPISHRLRAASFEVTAYCGLPLLLVAAMFGYRRSAFPAGKPLTSFLAVALLAGFGPRLHVAGTELFGLPWKLMTHVPLINSALPARFTAYVFLALALITSLWLASPLVSSGLKAAMVLSGALFLCPNLSPGFWVSAVDTPRFFSAGLYRRELARSENVMIIPYGGAGNSMLWQAQTGMYFRMAQGDTGPVPPPEFQQWPIVNALRRETYIPQAANQMLAFMAAQGVSVVIVSDRAQRFWAPMLRSLDSHPKAIGAVWLYRPPPSALAPFRHTTAAAMQSLDARLRFAALIHAANEYLAAGLEPSLLTPMAAQQHGLLPQGWVNDPDHGTRNGLFLSEWPNGRVAIGVAGSYGNLRPLIEHYRHAAERILFPYPRDLVEPPSGNVSMRLLVIVFDPATLTRIDAQQGTGARE